MPPLADETYSACLALRACSSAQHHVTLSSQKGGCCNISPNVQYKKAFRGGRGKILQQPPFWLESMTWCELMRKLLEQDMLGDAFGLIRIATSWDFFSHIAVQRLRKSSFVKVGVAEAGIIFNECRKLDIIII